ncbi:Os01g0751700 [Oryza sativa Japonica Group]|uniref:Os01g0751700 protein n=1 Tax=Oryza sativa subsp. japonica TaxID=39947 RepID=C7IWX9_ORYSJ|nr:Os01g0751700 [Oryza sativa Japonica Group]|eukprot:NP_001172569.1 Os01g0751700 [Oryza sativa Japonica Group]
MSSSTSPSIAPSVEYAENTFKSWPSLEKPTPDKSWTTWYQRVSASKKVHWDEIGIGQALTLTIANSAKDEPLMAAATYFWSNTINAFLFNQGPMTPTLIDITMITGLDVTSSANPMSMNTKNQFDFKTKSIGDWSGYVAAYMGQGSVTPREHVAFLLMWLEKFLFYGSSCGPTTNWQFVTEALESKKEFPLGKILLGYLYQMLNNASAKIAVGSIVGAGGPWWLLQTWLNLVVMKVVNRPSVTEAEFPLPEPIVEDDGEERTHRRCMSYGEYASTPTDAGAKLSAELLKDWFCSFYEGLIPNGGGLSPPFIGYHAPKTSTLLHGLTREPADAGKKRKTRSSAMSTLALAPKKKTKFKKTQPQPTDMSTDDLPALDPSIEQALDDEEIGEDVDQAVAEMSDTERTPSASPKQTPPTPYAPVHFTRQSSSDQTPSAVGSHHIEEEEQPAAPAIPALADLFSFDIRDYLDEAEEDTSSKALAPLSDDVRKTLEDISHRLAASSLDSLVVDRGSIRTRLYEVQALIPEDLADVLTLAAYLEQHQFKLEKAKLRLAERRDRKEIKATIQTNRQLVHEEKTKLDQLSEGLIKSNIDRLEARKIELLAQLEECNAELDIEHKKLADLPKSIEEQKARLKSAIKNVADLTKSLKVISGTDAQDAQAIEEVEQIRQRAILAIQRYLSQ